MTDVCNLRLERRFDLLSDTMVELVLVGVVTCGHLSLELVMVLLPAYHSFLPVEQALVMENNLYFVVPVSVVVL